MTEQVSPCDCQASMQQPFGPYLCDHKAVLSDELQRYLVCQDAGVAVGYVGNCGRRMSGRA